jgi:cytochrome c oxidase cbb3-type subunit III
MLRTERDGAANDMSSTKRSAIESLRRVIPAIILVCAVYIAPLPGLTAQKSPRKGSPSANGGQFVADGRQVFEGRCAGCHGLDGRGGERAPDIATRAAVQQRSDEQLFQIVKAGNPTAGMPAFPSLDDGTVKALIAYVRVLQGKGAAATIPGNPQNGEALFFGKARCSECHTLSGRGGFIASDLSAFGQGRSAQELREAIIKPSGNPRANAVVAVATHNGEMFKGVVRNEDNFSLQLQTLDGSFHLLMKPEIKTLVRQPVPLMPTDYGSRLSAQDLDDLIGFLMTAANKEHTPDPKKQFREDEENE